MMEKRWALLSILLVLSPASGDEVAALPAATASVPVPRTGDLAASPVTDQKVSLPRDQTIDNILKYDPVKEAASLHADSDDVTQQIKDLLNSERVQDDDTLSTFRVKDSAAEDSDKGVELQPQAPDTAAAAPAASVAAAAAAAAPAAPAPAEPAVVSALPSVDELALKNAEIMSDMPELTASRVREAALDDKLGLELKSIVEQIQDMQNEVAEALKDGGDV